MSAVEPNQVRRTSTLSWYSAYRSQIVGQPNTLWAPEDPRKMSNGYDDDDSAVRSSEEPTPDWNHSKDSDYWNSEDTDTWNHSKDTDHARGKTYKDEQGQPETNKSPDHDVLLKNSSSNSSSQALLRPLSMDSGWMEQRSDEAERKLSRSSSAFYDWDDAYEEFKLPKKYQKPATTKSNTRLSRTYITGAGSEKCANCFQRLYEMEKINANHSSYHRKCFQCSRCQRLLSLTNFISTDGQLYCKSHFLDVVSNKPSITQNHMSNTVEEKNPHLPVSLENNREICEETTLTSIADIKSRFEIPSSNPIESEKKAKITEPKKILQLTNKADTEEVHQPKPVIDDSVSSQKNKPFAQNTEQKNTRHTTKAKEAFAIPQSSTSPPLNKNGEDDIIPVADAFAKFKNMESMRMDRIQSQDIKPMTKITPPMHDIKSSANKETENHFPSSSRMQYDKLEERLPTVRTQEPATKTKPDPVSKDSVVKSQAKTTEMDYDTCENASPPVGITKRMVTQWKLMDTPDGAYVHRSTPSLGHSSHEWPTESASVISPTVIHSVPLVNGFHTTDAGSSHENQLELVRRHRVVTIPQDTGHVKKYEGHKTTPTGPFDFTRSQLARFRELESMAQKSANPYPPPKKDFRWDVKEVSPLHRPSIPANLPLAVQNGLKTDDHPAPLAATRTPSVDRSNAAKQQPTIACIKEALAQFKSMEDFTRPPPNPVLALSLQKAAVATPMKQYHDVIHVSYTIQTVKD